jgi:hypothetical protein
MGPVTHSTKTQMRVFRHNRVIVHPNHLRISDTVQCRAAAKNELLQCMQTGVPNGEKKPPLNGVGPLTCKEMQKLHSVQ